MERFLPSQLFVVRGQRVLIFRVHDLHFPPRHTHMHTHKHIFSEKNLSYDHGAEMTIWSSAPPTNADVSPVGSQTMIY